MSMAWSTVQRRMLWAALAATGVIVAYYATWLQPLERIITATVGPLLERNQSFSIRLGTEYAFFKNREAFFSETRACFERVQSVTVDEARLRALELENIELKEQLNFVATQSSTAHLSRIIAFDAAALEKVATIMGGSDRGFAVGDPVIAGKGILVGKIIRVDERTAQIRLVSDRLSRIEASIVSRDQTIGIVEGGFGISLQMKFVPRSEAVLVNQHIITSGREKRIPRGLIIGMVTTVENEAYQGFQRITLAPGVDLAKLSYVSVLHEEQPAREK